MTTDKQQVQAEAMQREYLSASQLAARLNVNRTTIWRLEKAGKLQGIKVGRAKRYDTSQVKRLG